MCDFHSIVIRRDGTISHVPENSHSAAVTKAGWRENDQMSDFRGTYFVEAEWNGEGLFPGAHKITRGSPNEKQLKIIKAHYTALASLLADPASNAERMLFKGGIFSGEEYADIRWRVINLDGTPKAVIKRLITRTLYADRQKPITSLHPSLTKINGSIAIAQGANVLAEILAEVTGNVDVSGTFTAPVLAEVTGYVDVRTGGTFTAPVLAEVTGYVDVSGTGKLIAPKLKR